MGSGKQSKAARKPSTGRNKRQGRRSHLPRWLRHRHLLTLEAMLLIGALEEFGQVLLERSGWPDWVQVLLIMALVIGAFTAILVFLQERAERTLDQTHKIVQAMPVPTPYILIHGALLFVLFLVYAVVLGKRVLGIAIEI